MLVRHVLPRQRDLFANGCISYTDKNTVKDFCLRIHKSLVANFKHAWVWGTSVKHNPQKVGLDHLLQDEDVVQIVKRV